MPIPAPPQPRPRAPSGAGPGANEAATSARGVAHESENPQQIGHYRVLDLLGSGVLTRVYRAQAVGVDRVVAIKVLRSTAGSASVFHRRFEREARLLASLHHPNLIELFDYDGGVAGERAPFMVLEHVTGGTLAQVLHGAKRLEPDEAAGVALEIARALAYAHGRGIVHRDVKPGNVLVGSTSTDRIAPKIDVKLLDFGIAIDTPRRHEARAVGAMLTDVLPSESGGGDADLANTAETRAPSRDGKRDDEEPLGTPAYMAPEQLLGEHVDARADQFALGIVLFQMLTGVRPFDGDDGRPAIQRVRRDPPRSFKSLGVQVPRSLERIVLRCLAKRPAERFESTAELVVELGHALGERVESLADLSGLHRRVLARAGLIEDRKMLRAPASQRASGPESRADRLDRGERDPVSMRAAPSRARAVPLSSTLLGVGAAALAMIVGGLFIQLRSGEFSRTEYAPPPSAAPLADGNIGYLRVRVRPWADVLVDDHKVDTTPISRPLPLRVGKHAISLVHPAETVRRAIDVRLGETTTLDVTLTVALPPHADEYAAPDPSTSAGASSSATRPTPADPSTARTTASAASRPAPATPELP